MTALGDSRVNKKPVEIPYFSYVDQQAGAIFRLTTAIVGAVFLLEAICIRYERGYVALQAVLHQNSYTFRIILTP